MSLSPSHNSNTNNSNVCSDSNPKKEEPYMPGTAGLIADIDKNLMVVLRDGRILIGWLRSIDQFANLVLQDTVERIFVGRRFGDVNRGVFLVRGENVALLGEMSNESVTTAEHLERVPADVIIKLQRQENVEREATEERRRRGLLERGIIPTVQEDWHDEYTQ